MLKISNETIAEMCHEVIRVYCESLGDRSQLLWKDAPEWQRNSAIKGVEYKREHPDATPSDIHHEWLKLKESEGWKYGPVKDVEKKEHPCMVPYEALPSEQQVKDHLYGAIVAIAMEINHERK